MNKVNLNEELNLFCPDGFRILSEEEITDQNCFSSEEEGIELVSNALSMTVLVSWKQLNAISAMMKNAKDIAKDMEPQVKETLEAQDYRLEGFREVLLGERSAYGFCYEYEADGFPMYGETFALKNNKNLYSFTLRMKMDTREEGLTEWKKICVSSSWLQ